MKMNFFDWLDKMRSKPERVRRRTTLVLAVFITLVIVAVWLTLFVGSGKRIDHESAFEGSDPFSVLFK
jgi:hypothetical protein